MPTSPAPLRPHAYTLARLRANPWLRACMGVALFCYGGACVLVIWQDKGASRLDFATAGSLVVMSLASWSLLFWWFPVLARTARLLGPPRDDNLEDPNAPAGLARALEVVATVCVVCVHVILLLIILHEAGL